MFMVNRYHECDLNGLAQVFVGLLYEKGEGVSQSLVKAKEWFGKACDNGYQKGCDSYRKLNETGY